MICTSRGLMGGIMNQKHVCPGASDQTVKARAKIAGFSERMQDPTDHKQWERSLGKAEKTHPVKSWQGSNMNGARSVTVQMGKCGREKEAHRENYLRVITDPLHLHRLKDKKWLNSIVQYQMKLLIPLIYPLKQNMILHLSKCSHQQNRRCRSVICIPGKTIDS